MAQEMSDDLRTNLKKVIRIQEDERKFPYPDPITGDITIAMGRNLSKVPLYDNEIDLMFFNDSDSFYNFLCNTYAWFKELNQERQIAMISLCYCGTRTFMRFKKMISAMERKDYKIAAHEIINSLYDEQLPRRAHWIADVIETGIIKWNLNNLGM